MTDEQTPLDPNRLSPEQAAKLLSAAAKVRIPVEQIAADLKSGAPQNADGTINLVHYAAWLVKEMGRGRLTRGKLRPSGLCRLLNSTPLGEVINERQFHRHRTRAGLRIGDGRHVDLLRYVAWLVEIRHEPKTGTRRRSVREAEGAARARNVGLGDCRSRHRRVARGRRRRAQGTGGIGLSVLLRIVFPAHVSSALVARSFEGHRQDRTGGACAADCLRWRCPAARARRHL